jgi:serine O-acetyltransferase
MGMIMAHDPLPLLTAKLVETYAACGTASYLGQHPLPSREVLVGILDDLFELMYPGFGRRQNLHLGNVTYHVGDLLDSLSDRLTGQIFRALRHDPLCPPLEAEIDQVARQRAHSFLGRLPEIRKLLETDVLAAHDGDPASTGATEVVFCYPGLYAITIYRLAHELLLLGVPLIPRMMSEYAHRRTGIDIHPAAQIGPSFFIDHGTGVVIGATCVIGEHVTLYQGVTLGAYNFPRDELGQLVRTTKRHPTLEDHVVVFANATVLGGDTIVGHHSLVGSNAWLTRSVAPYTSVIIGEPSLQIRPKRTTEISNWHI